MIKYQTQNFKKEVSQKSGRLLGIDFGEKRIGLAVSDLSQMIASAYDTFENNNSVYEKIISVIEKENVAGVVVGYPLEMSGEIGKTAQKVNKFADILLSKTNENLPILLFDERLTSSFVEKELIKADLSRNKRKKVIDKLSAVIILQNYLDT